MVNNKNLLILGEGQYGQVAKEIAEQSEMFETVALLDDLAVSAETIEFVHKHEIPFLACAVFQHLLKIGAFIRFSGHSTIDIRA